MPSRTAANNYNLYEIQKTNCICKYFIKLKLLMNILKMV